MIGFCPLASGSKGNAIYLGFENTKIIIDAGLSFSKLLSKLNEIDVNIEDIDAVFITHEHSDHISGLKVLTDKLNIPIIANSDTAKGIYNKLHILPKYKIFTTQEEFEFKDFQIFPFSLSHDTLDPVGFTIQIKDIKIGICTDLGFISTLIKNKLKDCDYLYIEANHTPHMVHASNRPYIYKQRVLSRQGHLSNDQCFDLLEEIIHPKLKHIYLAHISDECNSKDLLTDTAKKFVEEKNLSTNFSLAYQEKISKSVIF